MTRATIIDTARSIRTGALSAAAALDECLQRVATINPLINCVRECHSDAARAQAESIDRRLADGEDPGPLAGVPIAIKDNIVTSYGRTCCGSKMLESYESPFSATVVQRLLEAGAVVFGKTNCDEFAMGSSTEHCAYGSTANPWDTSRVPGGSSGGSAATVAARVCPAALGTDTGGSIRQPAALCGVVGLKPSYGRVSRYGLVAFGSSLDQVGPITHTVKDAAILLEVIAGADNHDSTCADQPVPAYTEAPEIDRPLRIGVVRKHLEQGNDAAVTAAVNDAIEAFRSRGATIVDVELPRAEHGLSTYYVIAPAEASSNLARFDGIRYGRRAEPRDGDGLIDLYCRSRSEGFGAEVQRRIMLGTYVLSAGYYDAYYLRALRVRRLIRDDFQKAFTECDVILGPTTPTPAFTLGEHSDPLSMYLCDVYTTLANIAGIPAMSIPAGWTADGLPVGVHLQAAAFNESILFQAAAQLESTLNLAERTPPVVEDTGT